MEIAQKILSGLFPSRCILCQKTVDRQGVDVATGLELKNVEICSGCLSTLPYNHPCCTSCALPLAEDVAQPVLCGRCIQKTPAFDYSYSLFRYEDALIKLVHQLKFSEKVSYARSIGEMLLSKLQQEVYCVEKLPDCLLPVPLHRSRLKQRGFNQSIEIARVIARRLQLPIVHAAVIRRRSTESQTGLSAKQRHKNIRGAFDVVGDLKGQHVLIIDDVVTTGSTVNELAKVLKKNGVKRVGVLSIARAPMKA